MMHEMLDGDHPPILDIALPIGSITQHIAAHFLTHLGLDEHRSPAKSMQRILRSLNHDQQLTFARSFVADMRKVSHHLLGPDILERLGADISEATHGATDENLLSADETDNILLIADATSAASQRTSVVSWISHFAAQIDSAADTPDVPRLYADDVIQALLALEWGEVLPIFGPYFFDKDPLLSKWRSQSAKNGQRRKGLPINAFAAAEAQCHAISWGEALIDAGVKPGIVHDAIVAAFGISDWDTARKWKPSFCALLGKDYHRSLYLTRRAGADANLEFWTRTFLLAVRQMGRQFIAARGGIPRRLISKMYAPYIKDEKPE